MSNQHLPLYKRVEQHILERINSGQLVPGDLIASEPQLAKQLDVSQGTVKKAIDNLVNEKRLYRHQGKGTYVSSIDFNNSLFRFFSYGDASGQGVRIHKETVERSLKIAPINISKALSTPAQQELLYIQRRGYIEEQPILIEHCWWCPEILPGLEKGDVHIPDLMYAMVVEKYGVPVISAEETLTADSADAYTAEALDIAENSPVVVLTRNTYSRQDRMIEYRTTIGRADKFSYKTKIR